MSEIEIYSVKNESFHILTGHQDSVKNEISSREQKTKVGNSEKQNLN